MGIPDWNIKQSHTAQPIKKENIGCAVFCAKQNRFAQSGIGMREPTSRKAAFLLANPSR